MLRFHSKYFAVVHLWYEKWGTRRESSPALQFLPAIGHTSWRLWWVSGSIYVWVDISRINVAWIVWTGCLSSHRGDKQFATSYQEMSFSRLQTYSTIRPLPFKVPYQHLYQIDFFFGMKMLLQEIICFLCAIHPSVGPSHAHQRQSLRASFFCCH